MLPTTLFALLGVAIGGPQQNSVDGPVAEALQAGTAEQPASSEVDEMRALEAASLDSAALATAAVRDTVSLLPDGTFQRDRIETALGSQEYSDEEIAFVLPRVANLSQLDMSALRSQYDIPVEMQPLVTQYIQFFQGPGRKWFRKWMSRSTRYIPLMQPILEANGLPRDTIYLAMIESGFSLQARSFAAALGPWQFIASTARRYQLNETFWVDERRDPVKSTVAAASFLRNLHDSLGHWNLAWAAYNTGGGRMQRMIDAHATTDFWVLSEKKGLAKETKHYVPKLIAAALLAKNPRSFGFADSEFEYLKPFEYDTVKLTRAVDLALVASAAKVPLDDIEELNAEVTRWCTPPASEDSPYLLRVPKGTADAVLARVETAETLRFRRYQVAKGDTVSKVASRLRSSPEAILRLNGLSPTRQLRMNAELMVPVPSERALAEGKPDPVIARQTQMARLERIYAPRPQDEVPAGTVIARAKAAGGSIVTATVDGKVRVTYGVGKGDSLWTIARRFDVRVTEVKAWNPALASQKLLRTGMALTVWPGPGAGKVVATKATTPPPQPARASAARPDMVASGSGKQLHVVMSGENMWLIARKYGTTIDSLKRSNNLNSDRLTRGQKLYVSQ